MKKLLLILLLIVLPLQYSWAAAAAYCQHETGKVTHFGHHTHKHEKNDGEASEKGKIAQVHSDCVTCHYSIQASFPTSMPALAWLDRQIHLQLTLANYSSYIADGPKQPDWSHIA